MYRVLTDFSDLQDNEHVYRAGDKFPRSGFSVSEERLKELSTTANRRGKVLIEFVPDENTAEMAVNAEIKPETEKDEEVTKKPRKSRKKALKGSEDGKGTE